MNQNRKYRKRIEHLKFTQRHCEGKNPTKNGKLARVIAAGASRRNGERYVAYRCEICLNWHIGHRITPARAARLRRERMAA